MTILVAMPYYRHARYLERAVRSVLAQSHRDLCLLIVGDGEEPDLRNFSDSRIEVYTLPENHGTYFATEVALRGSPFDWFAIHAADDYSDPDHLAQLVEASRTRNGKAVVTGAVRFHRRDGKVVDHRANYEVGLFRRDRLLEVGGHNPAERIGQDSVVIHMLALTGGFASTSTPTYHRFKNTGSLMMSAETRPGSELRVAMKARNRVVYAEAEALVGRFGPRGAIPYIRAYRESFEWMPSPVAAREILNGVRHHAARLSEKLGQAVAA